MDSLQKRLPRMGNTQVTRNAKNRILLVYSKVAQNIIQIFELAPDYCIIHRICNSIVIIQHLQKRIGIIIPDLSCNF